MSLPLLTTLLEQFVFLNAGLPKSLMARGLPSFIADLGLFFFSIPFAILFFILVVAYLFRKKTRKMFLQFQINDKLFTLLVFLFSILYIYLVEYNLTLFGINVIPRSITSSYFLTRHPFFLVFLIYIFLAYKIVNLKSRKLAVFCLILIIMVNSFSLAIYYHNPTKAEWKEAVSFIEDSEPLVLIDSGSFSNIYLLEYYHPGPVDIVKLTWANRTKEGRDLKRIDLDLLSNKLKEKEDFWLVLARGVDDYYKKYFDDKYILIEEKEFYELKLYRYGNKDQKKTY